MAPRSSTPEGTGAYGLALIAVDGKPPRAFAVGSKLDTDLVLQSVGLRTASLGSAQGARSVLLELPALPAPATGPSPTRFATPAAPAMHPGA
jgi:general secretion pathway protein C